MSKAMTAASKEQLIELMQYLSQNISVPTIGIGGGFAPIGTIISYMGTTAPQDYLICDGSTYNIDDYKQLSDFFASQFGSANFFGGDGVTTFKVPDLRGEFLRGSGTNSHTNQGSGANVGAHQDGTEENMIFTSVDGKTYQRMINRSASRVPDSQINSGENGAYVQLTNSGMHDWKNTDYAAFTSRPTNTSVLYCIKAVAAGDVYSTEERVVGTWIDGKPIYQKTFSNITVNPTTAAGTNVVTDIDITSLNLDECIFMIGVVKSSSQGIIVHIPTLSVAGNANNGLTCAIRKLEHLIRISNASWDSSLATITSIITIRYTKTTD